MEAIARGHALRYTAPPESVMVDYDERRIQRVLQNLIGNAIKYSPDGGDIDIDVRADGGNAAICIRDRGIGIPEADLAHVLDSFYRGGNVGAAPGTGLGLALVKSCADLHGGAVEIGSHVGEGTWVRLRLPDWLQQERWMENPAHDAEVIEA